MLLNNTQETITVQGESKKYTFQLFKKGTSFNALAGIYIFYREYGENNWIRIYIGETESFKDRIGDNFSQHHQYHCIVSKQYTHIAALEVKGGKQSRLNIETDIRHFKQGLCNDQ